MELTIGLAIVIGLLPLWRGCIFFWLQLPGEPVTPGTECERDAAKLLNEKNRSTRRFRWLTQSLLNQIGWALFTVGMLGFVDLAGSDVTTAVFVSCLVPGLALTVLSMAPASELDVDVLLWFLFLGLLGGVVVLQAAAAAHANGDMCILCGSIVNLAVASSSVFGILLPVLVRRMSMRWARCRNSHVRSSCGAPLPARSALVVQWRALLLVIGFDCVVAAAVHICQAVQASHAAASEPAPEPLFVFDPLFWVPVAVWSCTVLAFLPRRLRSSYRAVLFNAVSGHEARAAALISSLVSNQSEEAVLRMARRSFRVLPLSELREDDLRAGRERGEESRLRGLTGRAGLGDVDAFISHSWSDDAAAKYRALTRWGEAFEREHGRKPYVWLDKACLDQHDVKQNLACLPVYLAGCRTLVVAAGSSWPTRLWCVMELFTFLHMGGGPDRITVLEIDDGDGTAAAPDGARPPHRFPRLSTQLSPQLSPRLAALGSRLSPQLSPRLAALGSRLSPQLSPRLAALGSRLSHRLSGRSPRSGTQRLPVETFDVSKASCFVPEDRQVLLGAIETGFGALSTFNHSVRILLRTVLLPARPRARSATDAAGTSTRTVQIDLSP